MHSEHGEISDAVAKRLVTCRLDGGRIVAVGTTSVRVLESACQSNDGQLAAWSGETNIFIKPPYKFQAVDALLTNFHLPKSTLIMLVSAFAGRELIMQAYAEAIEQTLSLLQLRRCDADCVKLAMTASDAALQEVIARATHAAANRCIATGALGGSIHRVERIELADGRAYCVKSNVNAAICLRKKRTA